jgi:hypothetical protein
MMGGGTSIPRNYGGRDLADHEARAPAAPTP